MFFVSLLDVGIMSKMSIETLLKGRFEVDGRVVWVGIKRSGLRMEMWSI